MNLRSSSLRLIHDTFLPQHSDETIHIGALKAITSCVNVDFGCLPIVLPFLRVSSRLIIPLEVRPEEKIRRDTIIYYFASARFISEVKFYTFDCSSTIES